MIIYQSVIFITILISTINSHGYHHQDRNRQGNERTWFQMSIPFLDASIQFPQPPGLDPDRLFDMMTSPFQQSWNPLEPPSFMRPFFDRPNQFRPMMPPVPPPLPPFNPPSSESSPSTPSNVPPSPSTSNPNSISDYEPESTFNPSRRRYKPRWVPQHPRRPFGKRPGSGGRRGSGSGFGSGSSFGGNVGGCRNIPGTKGGRKCHPGQRFWEKSKPSPLPPSWPFFVFPPPRPSMSDDDDKPEVPNTFTEVTKSTDPACGNRHLPRPTKPATNETNSTTTSPTTTAQPPTTENDTERGNEKSNNVTTESTSSSPSSSSTTELPTTPNNPSVDVAPSFDLGPSQLSPSSSDQPPEKPSTSPEVSKSSNDEPEKGMNPSESDQRNRSNGSEEESGKKDEKKEDGDEPESSVSYASKEDADEDKLRERTNINNGEAISSSGTVTTMRPLESTSFEDAKVKEDEEKKKQINKTKDKDEDEDKKMKEDGTVDLKYSSSFSSSPPPELSSSSSDNIVTTMTPDNVNNESSGDLTTISPSYSITGSDTTPDEIDKSIDSKSASPEVEVKRKRQTEKEQFIKQIESMSIEEFRRLASRIGSISI